MIKVAAYSISLDGFGAGPNQSLENPLGVSGEELHNWVFPTRFFRKMGKKEGGTTGVDNQFGERSFDNLGAWIMGRNMFGPIRGDWPDDQWRGWWGDTPPYHCHVYVLTHYSRKPLEMNGGTVFHFVTEGIHSAVQQAKKSAAGRDIRIGGGASTVRQFLRADLIDELHLAVSPVLLGSGEPLFEGLDLSRFKVESTSGEKAVHYLLRRR